MPNLRGASPVGRDERGRLYVALTLGGDKQSRRDRDGGGKILARREVDVLRAADKRRMS